MATPNYIYNERSEHEFLTREQVHQVLNKLSLDIRVKEGQDLNSNGMTAGEEGYAEPNLIVNHYARMIDLSPELGKRITEVHLGRAERGLLQPGRVMDELTHGGVTCSYYFNTRDFGLPFEEEMILDIHKFGEPGESS